MVNTLPQNPSNSRNKEKGSETRPKCFLKWRREQNKKNQKNCKNKEKSGGQVAIENLNFGAI